MGITTFISSLDIGVITQISIFLDKFTYLILFLIAIYFIIKKKKFQIIPTCIILIILVIGFKSLFPVDRPCASGVSKIKCPEDFSFPSGHSTLSSAFLPLLLESFLFPFYLIFYILVIFSRIYLGVHYFNDIIFSTVLGISVYLYFDKASKVTKAAKRWKFGKK